MVEGSLAASVVVRISDTLLSVVNCVFTLLIEVGKGGSSKDVLLLSAEGTGGLISVNTKVTLSEGLVLSLIHISEPTRPY